MRKLLSKVIYKIGAVNYRLYLFFKKTGDTVNPVKKTLTQRNKDIWYNISGDSTLRVIYDLAEQSIVFDVGGYEGDWAAEIAARYNCRIYVFEPVTIYYKKLCDRFAKNKSVSILQYGLGAENKQLKFSILDQSSSAFKQETEYATKNGGIETVAIKSFLLVCDELQITKIDLLKINIEGGEYELLEQIISSGWIHKIKNIQIQFHDFVENADEKMSKIKSQLSKTHSQTYEYIYVWENWVLKTE